MGNIDKFDAAASRYDTDEREKHSAVIAQEIHKHTVNCKEKTAIDYGCGTGLIGIRLINDFKKITFADASVGMTEIVKKKLDNLGLSANVICTNLEFEKGNVLPETDYIFLVKVLLHVEDIRPLITRLHKLLNKGGHLIIVDFDKNPMVSIEGVHSGFDRIKLEKLLESTGFKVTYYKSFYREEKLGNADSSMFIMDAVTK